MIVKSVNAEIYENVINEKFYIWEDDHEFIAHKLLH